MLKEVNKRHEALNSYLKEIKQNEIRQRIPFAQETVEQVHQDRAYLLELKGGGMRPCPKWNSNKGICNLDSKTCMVSQYDWQNCPKGE